MKKKLKKRTTKEIADDLIRKHGCIPINLRFTLDPEVDYHTRMVAGINDEMLGPIKKATDVPELDG